MDLLRDYPVFESLCYNLEIADLITLRKLTNDGKLQKNLVGHIRVSTFPLPHTAPWLYKLRLIGSDSSCGLEKYFDTFNSSPS